jgi:hypothetical protein
MSFGVEISPAVESDILTAEHIDIWVILNNSSIAIDFHNVHHGSTPFSFSHFRMLAIAPLSVLGDDRFAA